MDRKYIGPVDVERVTFGDAIIGLYLQNLTLGIVEKFEDTRGLGLPWSRGIPLGCVGTEATQQGWMSREIHDKLFSKLSESHHLGAIQAGAGSDAWFIEDARLKTRSISFGREQLALAPVEYGLSGPVYNGVTLTTYRTVVGNTITTPVVDTRHLPGNLLRPWIFVDQIRDWPTRPNTWYIDVVLRTHATDPAEMDAEVITLSSIDGPCDLFLETPNLGDQLLAKATITYTRKHKVTIGTIDSAAVGPGGGNERVVQFSAVQNSPFIAGDKVQVFTGNPKLATGGVFTVKSVAGDGAITVPGVGGNPIGTTQNDEIRLVSLEADNPNPMNLQGAHVALLVDTADKFD